MNRKIGLLAVLFFPLMSVAESVQFELPEDIQFTGSVVDTSPSWIWQIYPTSTAWAEDWNIDRSEGLAANGITTFTYTENKGRKRMALLQGYMNSESSVGRSGIAPDVSVLDAGGNNVILNGNTDKQMINLVATGTSSDGASVPNGAFSLVIESAFAALYKEKGVEKSYTLAHYSNIIGSAAYGVILEQNASVVRNIYSNFGSRKYAVHDSGYSILSLLKGTIETQAYDILGGFTSHMSEIKTKWTVVPYRWKASLIINVRIQ